jgi:hypothetical protein
MANRQARHGGVLEEWEARVDLLNKKEYMSQITILSPQTIYCFFLLTNNVQGNQQGD